MLKLKSAQDVCKAIKEREQQKFAEDLMKHSFTAESERLIHLIDKAVDNCRPYFSIKKTDFIYWLELKKLLEDKGYSIIEYPTCLYIVFDTKKVKAISLYTDVIQAIEERNR